MQVVQPSSLADVSDMFFVAEVGAEMRESGQQQHFFVDSDIEHVMRAIEETRAVETYPHEQHGSCQERGIYFSCMPICTA